VNRGKTLHGGVLASLTGEFCPSRTSARTSPNLISSSLSARAWISQILWALLLSQRTGTPIQMYHPHSDADHTISDVRQPALERGLDRYGHYLLPLSRYGRRRPIRPRRGRADGPYAWLHASRDEGRERASGRVWSWVLSSSGRPHLICLLTSKIDG
jgi:hypothetical protein